MSLEWEVVPDAAAVAAAAARRVALSAVAAIARHGRFRLVLAGGQTPAGCYARLRDADCDWSRWEIFFGDERCVPRMDAARNSRLAREALLDHVPIPRHAVHEIPAEDGAVAGAVRYAETVASHVPFDLVLLGVGEDGHTASLFPGVTLHEDAWTVAVLAAPKPPPARVSLGLRALRAAKEYGVMTTGASKRAALSAWRAGESLPIAQVCDGREGWVVVDRASASDHTGESGAGQLLQG